jgi:hypothetical protein
VSQYFMNDNSILNLYAFVTINKLILLMDFTAIFRVLTLVDSYFSANMKLLNLKLTELIYS